MAAMAVTAAAAAALTVVPPVAAAAVPVMAVKFDVLGVTAMQAKAVL